MRIDVITPASAEPVSLAEAKSHLRIGHDSDDLLITGLVSAARGHVEQLIGYPIVTSGMRATLDAFPAVIKLPAAAPVQAVGVIAYTDAQGVAQTLGLGAYAVDLSGGGVRVRPAYGTSWPATRAEAAAVRMDFTVGYPVAAVPPSLKAAILLYVGDLYENAEAQIVGVSVAPNAAADNLVWPHRIVLP